MRLTGNYYLPLLCYLDMKVFCYVNVIADEDFFPDFSIVRLGSLFVRDID